MTARDDDLRADLRALANEWATKYGDHVAAAMEASGELMAALQIASGSVRKLCADELEAALDAHEPDSAGETDEAPSIEDVLADCGVRALAGSHERFRAAVAQAIRETRAV